MNATAIDRARQIYNVQRWGAGYFDINSSGEVIVRPHRRHPGFSLSELVADLRQRGVKLPVLVRFTDILCDRVERLQQAFDDAIAERHYQGGYTAVYPIKVNQQHSVVAELAGHESGRVGLEAGSKPELMAILGIGQRPLRIVCNGYKDEEFLRLATIGQAMGHEVFVVVEKLSELETLLKVGRDMGSLPGIGIRIRLAAAAKGKWQNTGGEKGKFGLTASQVLAAIELLRQHNSLSQLTLVHFHIGSQVANIRDIHRAMRECGRHYAELRRLGAPVEYVDVGGGLGVDYDGSGSRNPCSMNYSIEEYARNIVQALDDVCHQQQLPHPHIITESGRAMTAHHAVLITDIIDVEQYPCALSVTAPDADAPLLLQELWQSFCRINNARTALEAFHDAAHCYADAQGEYIYGLLSLAQWAELERLYFAVLDKVRRQLSPALRHHRPVLDEINEKLADKLFCNFSLFQSLPDVWGIDQIFPIMPLAYLNEPLNRRAILQDITCDSDGQIRQYADGEGLENTLPLPDYCRHRPFYLGIFMVGAYQEILGDLHNLFGDTDSVHVRLDAQGNYQLSQVLQGESVADVLRYVHFAPDELLANYRRHLQRAGLTEALCQRYFAELKAGIEGYTYFEHQED